MLRYPLFQGDGSWKFPGTGPAMLNRRSQILCAWFLAWDLALTALAWILAFFLRFESHLIPVFKSAPDFHLCVRNLPLVLLLAAIAYRLAGQYVVHRLRRLREEFASVVKGTALMVLFVIAATFGMQDPYESRATMALFAVLTGTMILGARRTSWFA